MDLVVMRRDLSSVLCLDGMMVFTDFDSAQKMAILYSGVVVPLKEAERLLDIEHKIEQKP